MARHNNICDGVVDLAGKYFTSTHVHDDPNIFTGRALRGGKSKSKGKGEPPQDKGGLKGDLLI